MDFGGSWRSIQGGSEGEYLYYIYKNDFMIPFTKVIDYLNQQPSEPLIFKTLGGRSKFNCKLIDKNNIQITNSKGTSYIINEAYWNLVMERRDHLRKNRIDSENKTSKYTDPSWKQGNRIFNPYLAAILKFFETNDTK
jgi:hypothetical protein